MHALVSKFLLIAGCLLAARGAMAAVLRIDNATLTLIEQVELPAKEAGSLAEITVREGDVVESGHALAKIEDDEPRLAATKAEHELAGARTKAENDVPVRFARKAHEVAAAEYRRALESVEKFDKSVSQTELDQLRLSAEKAQLEIEQADLNQAVARLLWRQKEAEAQSARLKLARHQLLAPFAGMVVQIKKQRGEWVNPGDAVLRLVRLDRLRVEAFAPARDVSRDLQGRPVALLVDLPGNETKHFEATVVFISPEIDPVNGQVLLWAEVDNRSLDLRPGQTAALEIDRPYIDRGADNAETTP